MSAIAGIWNFDGRPDAADLVERMQAALEPFGRDRAGAWDGGAVALGSRLTALLPEDVHDRQPLTGGSGRFVMVADLRLDNRPELWEALGIPRARGEAMADSDLLMAAWERWEERCPERLVGNFAFAVWDRRDRRLHLVRDHMGERPLFYHQRAGRIAFATMYHGLHALPDVPMAPDPGAVRAHAGFFADFGERSFFAGIRRVMPGTRLEIDAEGRTRADRYWDLPEPEPLRLRSDAEYVEAYRETFDRAVSDRLRATGRFGCHLSSGYDSSAVATTAAELLGARGQRITAYTAVPMAGVTVPSLPGQIVDESGIASVTAARYPNIDHILVGRDGRAMGDELEHTFTWLRQPLRNICNRVWRLDIARRMQERGERVLLNGIFGNLTVSYNGLERLPELFAGGRWRTLVREMHLLKAEGLSNRRLLNIAMGPFLPEALTLAIVRAGRGKVVIREQYSPLSPAALDAIRREEGKGRWEAMSYLGPGCATRRARLRLGLYQGDIGVHSKAMLGAFGTDERDASRDRRFVALILAMPIHVFLRDGQPRWIYRQAFARRVPREAMTTLSFRGYQAADWMHRLHKGRDRLNAVLDRAAGIPEIEEMFAMDVLRRWAGADLDHSAAARTEVRNGLRHQFLTGVSSIDFLLRAGLDRAA
ncbi:asparagine synthetase B family protein [Azospirillum halopraeferens]|uniref:asparagine synthetase B family protein n=1 Tax=Azospirillum halopraeferens TaxID=34010 RepID=UPI000402A261|nr:asparagine synthase-related protein [Azospirillum halopraeferens]